VIAYFDTSAIVPLVVDEPGSHDAHRLWSLAERLVTVRLAYAEGRAALARAWRLDRLDRRGLRRAVAALDDVMDGMDLAEVTDSLVRDAGELAASRALRGYDAVHLAAARSFLADMAVFVAADHELCEAAAAEGFAVADVAQR
jgi:predicted nucleic acid-binding protein